jgi:hypothetical protein
MQPPIDPRTPHEPVVDTSPITVAVRTLAAGGVR